MNRLRAPLAVLAAACLGLLVSACSGKAREKVYPVQGQVLLDGKPLAEATVVLHRPAGQALTTVTDGTGRFQVTTYQAGDGAPAGEYQAAVTYREQVLEGDEKTRTGRNLLPARYADPKTSGLRCEIRPGQNDLPPWPLASR